MTRHRRQPWDEKASEDEGVSGTQAAGMWLLSAEGFRLLVIVVVLLFVFGVLGCELRVQPG